MRTLAGWCVRRRRIVVLLWLAVLVSSLTIFTAVGTDYSNNFNFPHTQSFDAINLLKSVAPAHSGDTEEVVFGTSGTASLTDPAIGQRVNTMVDEINRLPHVSGAVSPYDTAGNLVNTSNINSERNVGFLQVPFDKQTNNISNAEAKKFVDTVTGTSGDGLTVAVTGQLAEQANRVSIGSTGLGVLLALVVLLIVFGSFFAAILPIISALFALGTAVRHHRHAEPRHRHAFDLAGADAPHRPRRGGGLRTVHRDPASPGARGRPRRRVLHHQRRQHLGPGGPVRRHHRVHRTAGHVRPGGQLPLRPGLGGRHRRGTDHGGRPRRCCRPCSGSSGPR